MTAPHPPKPPPPGWFNNLDDAGDDLDPRRLWLMVWSITIVGLIVVVNARLVWASTYPDSFREVSTLAITGILAAGAAQRPR